MESGDAELSNTATHNVELLRDHLTEDPESLTSHQVGKVKSETSLFPVNVLTSL